MYFLYSLALWFLFITLLPYFLLRALRHGKYAGSFKQRMGWLPDAVCGTGDSTIWLHAVSVGEFLAARVLIDRLRRELPDFRIVVSTTTETGQALARAQTEKLAGAFYFPYDWNFAVRRALDWVKPTVVIVLETELWPNFLRECRRRRVLTLLANGRISPRSFRRYRKAPAFIRRVIEDFSMIIMQSDEDRERVVALGAPVDRVRVCGNLKYDEAANRSRTDLASDPPIPSHAGGEPGTVIDRQFNLSISPHLIVAGSTAPGEEEILLGCLETVRRYPGLEDTRLLVAPRHPERFDEVGSLIARSGFKVARRSQASPGSGLADVILLDSIGELASAYRFAAVVFVGGSLVPRGGHNIIEPAAFGKAIMVGSHTENFRGIVADFRRANAVLQIDAAPEQVLEALSRELIGLLSDCKRAREMGLRARDLIIANQGATDCTIAALKEVLRSAGGFDEIRLGD